MLDLRKSRGFVCMCGIAALFFATEKAFAEPVTSQLTNVPPTGIVIASPPPRGLQLNYSLLSRLQRNELTISNLADRLGDDEPARRQEAAGAILALHYHYLESLHELADKGFNKAISPMLLWHVLNAIAALRPNDPKLLQTMASHSDFRWEPMIAMAKWSNSRNAPTVLICSGLPTLPILADEIGENTIAVDLPQNLSAKTNNPTLIALAIMRSATSAWLDHEIEIAKDNVRKNAFQTSKDGLATTGKPTFSRNFGQSDLLRSLVIADPYLDLSSESAINLKIDWDAVDLLEKSVLKTPAASLPNSATEKATTYFSLVSRALELQIILRTMGNETKQKRAFQPYSKAAQTDAIRVLGCLRSAIAGPVIVERLRAKSRTKPIDEDTSAETVSCLRALGQIDIPVALHLTDRIAKYWAEDQQLAAAYALGKVMGRYGVFFINEEIEKRGGWSALAKDSKDEVGLYADQIKRLENALKVGQVKHWFEGEYYGYNDPHAYDLIFPEDKPEAPKPADGAAVK